jgi:hypothetical protein
MNMLISQVPTDIPSSVSPTQKLPDPEVQKVADMVFAKALLSTEHVDSSEIKRARNRVSVRIEEIVRAKGSIYVRYQLTNQSRSPYRVFEPSVKTVSGSQSQLSLDSLTNRQIKEALLLKLGSLKSTELSVVWSDISRQDLAPGQSATGVIAIRKTDEEPSIFQFVFTSDGNSLVVATAVL